MPDDIDDLEAQAALHRAGVAAALSGLTQGAQPSALAGGDIAQTALKTALDTARRNPLGAVLVGAGVALLLAQSRPADAPGTSPEPTQPKPADAKPQPDSDSMRLTLHEGLGHLPPEARKRVIQKRLNALQAQEKVEDRPTDPLSVVKSHPIAALLAVVGLGAAVSTLWPRQAIKAQKHRDDSIKAAEAQLRAEETRMAPFPGHSPNPDAARSAQDIH